MEEVTSTRNGTATYNSVVVLLSGRPCAEPLSWSSLHGYSPATWVALVALSISNWGWPWCCKCSFLKRLHVIQASVSINRLRFWPSRSPPSHARDSHLVHRVRGTVDAGWDCSYYDFRAHFFSELPEAVRASVLRWRVELLDGCVERQNTLCECIGLNVVRGLHEIPLAVFEDSDVVRHFPPHIVRFTEGWGLLIVHSAMQDH